MYHYRCFSSRRSLDEQFALQIADILRTAILRNGRASMAVSGGNTPRAFFSQLSRITLDWEKVQITLVDDRWVAASHRDSNQSLVRDHLLIHLAEHAQFFPISNDAGSASGQRRNIEASLSSLKLPLDIVILGMGNDGHTASLFPVSGPLPLALDKNSKQLLFAITPDAAPHQRMSFGLNTLLRAEHIFLHLYGEAKKETFERALSEKSNVSAMPVRAFINDPESILNVLWAP